MEKYQTNFKVATMWCNNSYVLCNNLPNIDPTIWNNIVSIPEWFKEEDESDEEEFPEVMQYFITDCSQRDVEYLSETFGLLFTYSELLDCYILLVTHWGTGWDYVYWETTNKIAERKLGESK